MEDQPTVAWVVANPDPSSFSHSVATAMDQSGTKGTCFDLYAMNFDPVLTVEGIRRKTRWDGPIQEAQALISHLTQLIFVFPLWWDSAPAMAKGWVDWVFQHGNAWERDMKENGPIQSTEGKLLKSLTIHTIAHGDQHPRSPKGTAKRRFAKPGLSISPGIPGWDPVIASVCDQTGAQQGSSIVIYGLRDSSLHQRQDILQKVKRWAAGGFFDSEMLS